MSVPIRATTILSLGEIGKHAVGEEFAVILELLFMQLGSPHSPLISLATTEVGTTAIILDKRLNFSFLAYVKLAKSRRTLCYPHTWKH